MSAPTDAAHVRVVRGAPDEHELAALVAGLVVASGHPEDRPPRRGRTAAACWPGPPRGRCRRLPAPTPGAGACTLSRARDAHAPGTRTRPARSRARRSGPR